MKILDGKECSEYYYSHFPKDIKGKFHIITIGDDPASKVYVKNKIKACERLGIEGINYKFNPSDYETTEELYYSILDLLDKSNRDDNVLGIMIQQPYTKELEKYELEEHILKRKDVDGLNSLNMFDTLSCRTPKYYPATPKGIIMLLDYYNIDLDGKNVVIINRSDIVGKPLAAMILKRNATVTVCHSHTKNLDLKCQEADIIITAVGKPKYLNSEYIWWYNEHYEVEGNCPIIIDVAMCRDENGKLCGDVDFEDVKDHISAITPVPGGCGPMTVCALMSNLVESYGSKSIEQK